MQYKTVSNSAQLKHKTMKSTIRVDLDWDNNPILVINHVATDDLRDKAVGKLLEGFNTNNGIMYSKVDSFESLQGPVSLRPIYTRDDLDQSLNQLVGLKHRQTIDVINGAYLKYLGESKYDLSKLGWFNSGDDFGVEYEDTVGERQQRQQLLSMTDKEIESLMVSMIEEVLKDKKLELKPKGLVCAE